MLHCPLKKKTTHKVSVSQFEFYMGYDKLAKLIDTGIATDMKQLKPERWEGNIDVSR